MFKKTSLILLLCVISSDVLARDYSVEVLPSRKLPIVIMKLVEVPKPNFTIEHQKLAKKGPKPFAAVNLPFVFQRETVDLKRFKTGNINLGSVIQPWAGKLFYDFAIAPELVVTNDGVNMILSGGILKAVDSGIVRKNKYIDISTETDLWLFVVGGSGFVDEEKITKGFGGTQFPADFRRTSYGGRGWAGLKLGKFYRNFIAVRIGKGLVGSYGDKKYIYSGIADGLEEISVYKEEFEVNMLSAEERFVFWHFVESVKAERNEFKRRLYSSDLLRFGLNRFSETRVAARLEFIPSLKHDAIRMIGEWNKFFGSKDVLLFRNNPPEFQVYLRIKF